MAGERRNVKPTARLPVGGRRRRDHRLGVLDARRERLLAEHVLAGLEQTLDDLAVQRVGDDDADDVDVGRLRDRLPARLGALVAEARAASCAKAALTSAIATSSPAAAASSYRVLADR